MSRARTALESVGNGMLSAWKNFWNLAWGTETPLVVTIGLAVLAAWLSPLVTERFERQRMRSEYVLANLRELNALISDVYVNVSSINYAVAAGQTAPTENVDKAREALAKLNWKAIETAAMLPKHQRRPLKAFQAQALDVSNALDGELDIARCQDLLGKVNAMALGGAKSIQAVGRYVELAETVPTPSWRDRPAQLSA